MVSKKASLLSFLIGEKIHCIMKIIAPSAIAPNTRLAAPTGTRHLPPCHRLPPSAGQPCGVIPTTCPRDSRQGRGFLTRPGGPAAGEHGDGGPQRRPCPPSSGHTPGRCSQVPGTGRGQGSSDTAGARGPGLPSRWPHPGLHSEGEG